MIESRPAIGDPLQPFTNLNSETNLEAVLRNMAEDGAEATGRRSSLLLAAKLVYLLSAMLHYVDALRFQYTVSPDYAALFWLVIFPVSLIFLGSGWLALTSQHYARRLLALISMLAFNYYFTYDLPNELLPSGYPTVTPNAVYWALFAGELMLLVSVSRYAKVRDALK